MNIFTKPTEFLKTLAKNLKDYINSAFDFAVEHKQLVRITGTAFGIIICSLVITTVFTSGYEVYLGGEKVAVVEEKETFEKSFEEANAKITAILGKGYGINKLPKYVFTVALKASVTDEKTILDNVMAQSDRVKKVSVIKVDGEDIVFAQNEQSAEKLIEKAISFYDGENKKVLNDIKIEPRYERAGKLTDDILANTLLRNVLKVQSEKISVYETEILYSTTKNKTEKMYINEEKTLAQGEKGVMEVTAKVTQINGAESAKNIISTKVIKEPVNEVVMVGTAAPPSVGTGNFIQPYFGTITSRFGARWGRTHTGTDIRGTKGDPIKAADTGIVITAEYQDNGYGNIIIIDHKNGIHTWYAHLDSIGVKAGDVVEKGSVIGKLGSTGYSTGPHLHFEVRENGTPVDPGKYLNELK